MTLHDQYSLGKKRKHSMKNQWDWERSMSLISLVSLIFSSI